jgi:hypothetical protein
MKQPKFAAFLGVWLSDELTRDALLREANVDTVAQFLSLPVQEIDRACEMSDQSAFDRR